MSRLSNLAACCLALLSVPVTTHASIAATPIPEPDSWALVAVAVAAMVFAKARDKRK